MYECLFLLHIFCLQLHKPIPLNNVSWLIDLYSTVVVIDQVPRAESVLWVSPLSEKIQLHFQIVGRVWTLGGLEVLSLLN